MLLVFAFILLTGVCFGEECKCGQRKTTRILNGEVTRPNEFPAMAGYMIDGKVHCGATIISDRFAITSAECVVNAKNVPQHSEKSALLVGAHDGHIHNGIPDSEKPRAELIPIEQTYHHTYFNYTGNYERDIGFLKTDKSITFNEYVGPACLPFGHEYDTFEGETVTVTGWGPNTDGQPKTTHEGFFLHKGEVTIVNQEFCTTKIDSESQMCTSSPSITTCSSDAGGPVFWTDPRTFKLIFVGIISERFSWDCHLHNGIYTRVSSQLHYIATTLEGVEFCRA